MANPIDGENGSHAIVALVVVTEEEVEARGAGRGEPPERERSPGQQWPF